MLHWTWWLLTLALQGKLYRALHPKLYARRNLCMYDFLKLHHNWDAYMGVQKERKSTLLTAFEQREKQARSLFAAQYWYRSCLWMSLSSESSVPNIIPRYLYWSTEFMFWPPKVITGVAVLLALLALNVIQTVLLQLKMIPCDSAYAWHTLQMVLFKIWKSTGGRVWPLPSHRLNLPTNSTAKLFKKQNVCSSFKSQTLNLESRNWMKTV